MKSAFWISVCAAIVWSGIHFVPLVVQTHYFHEPGDTFRSVQWFAIFVPFVAAFYMFFVQWGRRDGEPMTAFYIVGVAVIAASALVLAVPRFPAM